MRSSRPSDAALARVFRHGLRGRAILFLAALCAIAFVSCKDELDPPTLGSVEIRLTSPTAGGIEGARVYWGDSLLVAAASAESYRFFLPGGTQVLRVEKDCSSVSPAEPRLVEVEPGHSVSVGWEVLPGSSIEVVSTMRGARVRVDGIDTGKSTPTTLSCIPLGSHRVSVNLLGATAGADSAKTVDVGEGSVRVDFDLEPLPQARRGLVEVFTATYCPNCAAADAAAESLWTRIGAQNGYIGLQCHTRWSGRDSLATTTSINRNVLYGDLEAGGIPAVMFAGTQLIRGAGSNIVEEIIGWYTAALDQVRNAPAAVAIHWLDAHREPGQQVTGRARVICLRDLPESEEVQVRAATYKDGLVTRGVHGIESFRHVVREYKEIGNAYQMGLVHRGDWADVDVVFDISGDTRPSGALWSEERMGMVVFLQSTESKEVLQATHTTLP